MIYSNIAEYEEEDSQLARQTILDLHREIERLNNENKMLKEAVKEKVIATCNTCEYYGICPHSYREYDLDNIIKEVRECVEHYAIENDDYTKLYSQEEQDILKILDKENK